MAELNAELYTERTLVLRELSQSRYFELFWPHTKLPLNGRKPENNSLIRWKNTKDIMINHKGTEMAKDGED